jgi:hypothetical protein
MGISTDDKMQRNMGQDARLKDRNEIIYAMV